MKNIIIIDIITSLAYNYFENHHTKCESVDDVENRVVELMEEL